MIVQRAAELKHDSNGRMEFGKSSNFFFCLDISKQKVKKFKINIGN